MVYFGALGQDAMEAIAQKYLDQLQDRTAAQGIQLQLPRELASILGKECRGKGGARQLRRSVQEKVEGPLAAFLLQCGRKPSRVRARLQDEELCFQV